MPFTLIGLGLGDEKDITLKGYERIKDAHAVYFENYTSFFGASPEQLSEFYGKHVIPLTRERVESGDFLDEAKENNVVLLVVGDPFSATTHYPLIDEARKKGITVDIIHNTSIMTAVGETGLSLYKFGQTTSLPWEHKNIDSTYTAVKDNLSLGLHTLVLLDLDPINKKTVKFADACRYLLQRGIEDQTKAVGVVQLGQPGKKIIAGTLKELSQQRIDAYPQCLVVCGKMHFVEEEALAFLA